MWLTNKKTGGRFEVDDNGAVIKNELSKTSQIEKNRTEAKNLNSQDELPRRVRLPRVKAEVANKSTDILDLKTLGRYKFKEGTDIRNVYAFCGKGSSKEFRDAEKYARRYGGNPKDWQHCAGDAIITNGRVTLHREIHWVQIAGGEMKEAFIKERERRHD